MASRKPNKQLYSPPRSIRVSDEIWEKAKRRAKYENTTPSYVVNVFLEGYANGLINLPQTQVVYPTAIAASEKPAS